jgi:HTH-type transcriptional regulator, competence development regulator
MSSKLTAFGRMTRKIRVEHDEYLKDMAEHLDVSPAYLSAVERGQRNAPAEWVGVLQEAYNLTHDTADCMKRALMESRTYAKLDISHLSSGDKRLIERMAEQLSGFEASEREQLQQLLNRRKAMNPLPLN